VGKQDSYRVLIWAREGDPLLWLNPILMLLDVLLGLARTIWEGLPALFGPMGALRLSDS
jgi:hypothetical protein